MSSQQIEPADKQKRREKRQKKRALKSFLQNSQQSTSIDHGSCHISDQQQKLDEQIPSNCSVCGIQLGDRNKKSCGFCNQITCNDHMRKKRKNKELNKFIRICDSCEDRHLFNKYMKLQVKNEEAISVQETVIQQKKNEIEKQLNSKKIKLKLIQNEQKQILDIKKLNEDKLNKQQNEIKIKQQKLYKKINQINNLQKQIKQLQISLPPSYQNDYQTLQKQSNKVNQQLLKYQKLCAQALKAKLKRQKQMYNQYNQWQNIQKQKIKRKQKQQCYIF